MSLFQNKQNFKLSGKLVLFYRSIKPGGYLLEELEFPCCQELKLKNQQLPWSSDFAQTLLHLCTVFCSCIVLPNQVVHTLYSSFSWAGAKSRFQLKRTFDHLPTLWRNGGKGSIALRQIWQICTCHSWLFLFLHVFFSLLVLYDI